MNLLPKMATSRGSLYLTLALVLAATAAVAQTSAPKTQHNFSKEAAVIESYDSAYRFENDGTGTEDVTARIKILSQAGVQQYGVLVFSYPSATQHIKIDYVRVRQPDGTVVLTPPTSIEDVTPRVTLAAPEYSDFKEKHVAVKGLVPGSELEYHVHFEIYAPLIPGQFWLAYDFTKDGIILDEELHVNVPKDRPLKLKSASIQPSVTVEGDRKIFSWKSSNLTEVTPRPYPTGKYPPPDVLLSTFQTWAQVGQWWASLEDPQMVPTAAITAKAAELTKSLTTEDQKLRAIYGFVAEQFRYIGISFGIGRYKPHAADQVLSNGYGDCKDKHTLLAALLQAAGIKAYPALINSSRRIEPDVPSPGQFDHVITVVPEGQKLSWMDTTTELAPMGQLFFSLRGKRALVVPSGQPAYLAMTPAEALEPDRVNFEAKGELSSDGVFKGTIKDVTSGDRALVMRLLFNNIAQSYWQKAAQGMSDSLGFGGTVSNVQVTPPEDTGRPFSLSYDYVRKDYSNWSSQSPHEISPPLPFAGLPAPPHSDDKTPQPLVLGETLHGEYHAAIKIPDGWKVTLPKPVNLSTPFGDFNSSYTFEDGTVVVDRKLVTKTDEVPVAELEAYRKFQKAVSSDLQSQITLAGASASAGIGPPASPEFQQDMNDAFKRMRQGDVQGAHAAQQRALDTALRDIKANPKSEVAWRSAGQAYVLLLKPDSAIKDFQKAVALDPKDPLALGGLATALRGTGKLDQAIAAYRKAVALVPTNTMMSWQLAQVLDAAGRETEVEGVWRDFIKASPQSAYAHANLGGALLRDKKYDEAIQVFEATVKLAPKSWWDEVELANSYAGAGRKPQAALAFEKAAEMSPSPTTWNEVGYDMADHDIKLPEAETFVKMAVDAAENAAANTTLDKLQMVDLFSTTNLAYYWDSLGWVYFREGDAQKARQFVEASWDLGQMPVVADHLGQIDDKLGKKQRAAEDYAWAVALSPGAFPIPIKGHAPPHGSPSGFPEAHDHLMRLVGSAHFDAAVNKARNGLSAMRTYNFDKVDLKPGTAEFFVLIGQGDKAEGVRFISGDATLREAAPKLRALHFNEPFPDDGPEMILRRGILSCEPGVSKCGFVLLLPGDVHSIN